MSDSSSPNKSALPDFLTQHRTPDQQRQIAERHQKRRRRMLLMVTLASVVVGAALYGFHRWSNAIIAPPVSAETRANAFMNGTFALFINPAFHDPQTRDATLAAYAEAFLPPGTTCNCDDLDIAPEWLDVESFVLEGVRYSVVDDNPLRTELLVVAGTLTLTLRDGRMITHQLSDIFPGLELTNRTAEWYIYKIYQPQKRDPIG